MSMEINIITIRLARIDYIHKDDLLYLDQSLIQVTRNVTKWDGSNSISANALTK